MVYEKNSFPLATPVLSPTPSPKSSSRAKPTPTGKTSSFASSPPIPTFPSLPSSPPFPMPTLLFPSSTGLAMSPPVSPPPLDSLDYSSLLLKLPKSYRFTEIELVMEIMREGKLSPTQEALRVLLARFSNSGMVQKAMEYDLIREKYDALPHVVDCDALLKLVVKCGSRDVASKVYDEMLEREGGDHLTI